MSTGGAQVRTPQPASSPAPPRKNSLNRRFISSWKDGRCPIGVHRTSAMVAYLPTDSLRLTDRQLSATHGLAWLLPNHQDLQSTIYDMSVRSSRDRGTFISYDRMALAVLRAAVR